MIPSASAFRTVGSLLLLTVILTASWGNLSAQPQEFPDNPPDFKLLKAGDLIDRGDYDDALEVLLTLIDEDPDNLPVLALLQRAYTESKNYEKAVEIVRRIEAVSGNSLEACLSLGDLYLKMNQPDSAGKYLRGALTGTRSDRRVYPRVANIYRGNGIYESAIETYLKAKTQFHDPSLFSYELGQLYEFSRNYRGAAREYFLFMMSDTMYTARGEGITQRLIEYVDDPEDIAGLKEVFLDLADSHPGNFRPKKYLADILIRQDSLDRAFELYKEIDRIGDKQGSLLVHFARRCLDEDSPDISSRACRYVLQEYPGQPHYVQAMYVLSSAYIMMDHPDSAVAIIRKIIEIVPDSRDKVEANFAIGEIYLRWLKNPDSAIVYFDMVLEGGRILRNWYLSAMLRKGDCKLVAGDLVAAESLYQEIDPKMLGAPDQEYLLWNKAQVEFFNHRFDDAKRLYAELTVNFDKGLFVNDCLRRMLMIDENTGFDRLDLSTYAEAEYYMVRSMYDSAEANLISLSTKSGSNLAEISTFKLGELYLKQGDSEAAMAAFESVLTDFEDSFWGGESQRFIADIYFERGDLESAQEAYMKLLTEYDNVLLKEHAREKLRQIEGPQL